MSTVKTVRLLLTDKSKEIPIRLYDPFLKEFIELRPDGVASESYAKELTKSYDCYTILSKTDLPVDVEGYKIRADYKVKELGDRFSKLTPEQKEKTILYMDSLLNNTEQKETIDEGNNSSESKRDS